MSRVGSQVNIGPFGTKQNLIEPEVVFGKQKYKRKLFVSFQECKKAVFGHTNIFTLALITGCYS